MTTLLQLARKIIDKNKKYSINVTRTAQEIVLKVINGKKKRVFTSEDEHAIITQLHDIDFFV